jgi:hypothetical protein
MVTSVLGQAMGFDLGVTLVLSVIAGAALAVLIATLAERYLFPLQHDR